MIQKQKTMLNHQLEAFVSSGAMDIEMRRGLKSILAKLEREQQKAEARLETLADQHYQKTYQRLMGAPGIGKKTSILLIAMTDGFKKLDSCKQLVAYARLSPRVFQSES